MNDGTRRTIEELATLYELEPEISEVITEGPSDAGVILWFLQRNASKAAVFEIADRIHIPDETIRSVGQNTHSRKGAVIAAALSLASISPQAAQSVTFVFDLDDDVIAGRPIPIADCLLHTDYRTIENYAFAVAPLEKALKVTLLASDAIKAGEVLVAITEPLVAIAFARLTLSRIDPPIGMITAVERRCSLNGDSLSVNIDSLISDSVSDGGGFKTLSVSKNTVMADYAEARAQNTVSDVRLIIRGHDFTRICCYYLKSRHPSLFRENRIPYKTPEVFEGLLLTCLESADLRSEEMFKKLLDRHGGSRTHDKT